jgi:MFS family permease
VQGGLFGALTRRFGEARLVTAGLIIATCSFGFLPYAPGIPSLMVVLGTLAVGTGLINPSLSSLTSRVVDPDEVGGVLGVYQSMGSLGRIVGPFTGVVAFEDIGHAWPSRIAACLSLAALVLAITLMIRLRGRPVENGALA